MSQWKYHLFITFSEKIFVLSNNGVGGETVISGIEATLRRWNGLTVSLIVDTWFTGPCRADS